MLVYRKRILRQNDCFIVDGADFNFDEVTVATRSLRLGALCAAGVEVSCVRDAILSGPGDMFNIYVPGPDDGSQYH